MKTFKSKKQVFNYIVKMFSKDAEIICVHGTAANKPLEDFSDIDIEAYSKKHKKPYYEIIFVGKKVVLISVYWPKFVNGKKARPPKGTKVLYGEYNDKIEPDFSKDKYKLKDKAVRECQLVTDFLFKYFRGRDKTYLEYTQKRLRF